MVYLIAGLVLLITGATVILLAVLAVADCKQLAARRAAYQARRAEARARIAAQPWPQVEDYPSYWDYLEEVRAAREASRLDREEAPDA